MTLSNSIFNNPIASIASELQPPLGTCGNCADKAVHPLETICARCATDLGLYYDTFPEYYYPSELCTEFGGVKPRAARQYFIFGI
jgi:hypothetical protein